MVEFINIHIWMFINTPNNNISLCFLGLHISINVASSSEALYTLTSFLSLCDTWLLVCEKCKHLVNKKEKTRVSKINSLWNENKS